MRQELLKILTADDVQEILDAGQLLWENYEEPTARNILRHLLEDNACTPSVGERFPFVLSCAEQAVGRKLSRERCEDNTLIRSFVSYRLRKEGYGYSETGRMIQRDHSTVIYLYNKAQDMLSVPKAYRKEIEMFRKFEELLGQPLQCSQPSSQTTSANALAESPAK